MQPGCVGNSGEGESGVAATPGNCFSVPLGQPDFSLSASAFLCAPALYSPQSARTAYSPFLLTYNFILIAPMPPQSLCKPSAVLPATTNGSFPVSLLKHQEEYDPFPPQPQSTSCSLDQCLLGPLSYQLVPYHLEEQCRRADNTEPIFGPASCSCPARTPLGAMCSTPHGGKCLF